MSRKKIVNTLKWYIQVFIITVSIAQLHASVWEEYFLSPMKKIIEGPLNSNSILAMIDSSTHYFIEVDEVTQALRDFPYYLVCLNNTNHYPVTLLQFPVKTDVIILVTGNIPQWLHHSGLPWGANTLLIVNVNQSFDFELILKSEKVQRFKNIAALSLLTANSKKSLGLYTSKPFTKTANGKSSFKSLMGIWNNSRFSTRESLFPDRFPSFSGETLHVASDIEDYPFVLRRSDRYQGVSIAILETLASKFNFSYSATVRAPDNLWGEKINGNWVGLLKEVYEGRKNLTINFLTLTFERSKYFDFSVPFFYEGFNFALRKPFPLPLWQNLANPFNKTVWISVLFIVIAYPPILAVIEKYSENEKRTNVSKAYFDTLKSFLRQSINFKLLPTSIYGKACLLTWWFGIMIITTSYSGNLIAVLTFPAFPPKISTLKELSESDLSTAMVNYGEFVPDALKSSADAVLRDLGRRMELIPLLHNNTDSKIAYEELLVEYLGTGKAAIIDTSSFLRKLIYEKNELTDKVYYLREHIYRGSLVFYYPKYTPWRQKFDKIITQLVESGIVDKWHDDLMQASPPNVTFSTFNVSLSLKHLQGPFFIYIFGISLATLVLAAELLWPMILKLNSQSDSN